MPEEGPFWTIFRIVGFSAYGRPAETVKDPTDARLRLVSLLNHPYVEFYNQSRRISNLALDLAVRHSLGGRDSLILANLMANNVPVIYTHDKDLSI